MLTNVFLAALVSIEHDMVERLADHILNLSFDLSQEWWIVMM